jgi:hypothetical protein
MTLGFTQSGTEMNARKMFLGSGALPVRKVDSRLSRPCEIHGISQPCRPPPPVTGIHLHFCMRMMFVARRKHTYGPSRPVKGWLYFSIYSLCAYLTSNTPVVLHGLLQGWLYFFV